MRVFIIAATLLAGALIPVQTAINSQLRVALFQSPVLASLVSFAVGTIALALVYFGILRGAVPDGAMLLRTSWWMWIGGVLGAFFVMMGIVAAPRVGVATVVVALTAGQLAMALVLDHFGLIGLPIREITPLRLTGALVVLLGAFVSTRG